MYLATWKNEKLALNVTCRKCRVSNQVNVPAESIVSFKDSVFVNDSFPPYNHINNKEDIA